MRDFPFKIDNNYESEIGHKTYNMNKFRTAWLSILCHTDYRILNCINSIIIPSNILCPKGMAINSFMSPHLYYRCVLSPFRSRDCTCRYWPSPLAVSWSSCLDTCESKAQIKAIRTFLNNRGSSSITTGSSELTKTTPVTNTPSNTASANFVERETTNFYPSSRCVSLLLPLTYFFTSSSTWFYILTLTTAIQRGHREDGIFLWPALVPLFYHPYPFSNPHPLPSLLLLLAYLPSPLYFKLI